MTLDDVLAVFQQLFTTPQEATETLGMMVVARQQFLTAPEFARALALLDARIGVEMAQGVQRLAQAQADSATMQAQQAIQAAQAQRLAAEARFDALVASMAG